MLITSPIGSTVERILRNAEGRLVRATFYIYESHGRVKARLVEAVVIDEPQALPSGIFTLSGVALKQVAVEVKKMIGELIVSPYQEILYFAGSKPRAPSKVS